LREGPLDVGQGLGPINRGLARAETIQIRTIYKENGLCHVSALFSCAFPDKEENKRKKSAIVGRIP